MICDVICCSGLGDAHPKEFAGFIGGVEELWQQISKLEDAESKEKCMNGMKERELDIEAGVDPSCFLGNTPFSGYTILPLVETALHDHKGNIPGTWSVAATFIFSMHDLKKSDLDLAGGSHWVFPDVKLLVAFGRLDDGHETVLLHDCRQKGFGMHGSTPHLFVFPEDIPRGNYDVQEMVVRLILWQTRLRGT